ncbi:MAG: hypothetical protein HQ591_04510 [candidate division Zixibacteria bacterium]|nr:hypothetical protein [Candidatus Tariuqbacter arcticus]
MPRSTYLIIIAVIFNIMTAHAQEPDGYIESIPFIQYHIISQTDASKEFNLYGPIDSSDSLDINWDGMYDKKYRRLMDLSKQFSPDMVKNSILFPVDAIEILKILKTKKKGHNIYKYLYLDIWDIKMSSHDPIKDKNKIVNIGKLGSKGDNDNDRKLLKFLKMFDPYAKNTYINNPECDTLGVLFFDFPGEDEKSWNDYYSKNISVLQEHCKIYSHHFIEEIEEKEKYEYVIQYWFFYPFNDFANDHEGDWEHINVVITFEKLGDEPMDENDINSILHDEEVLKSLVIKRVEYYFHHKVMILDYMNPNIYKAKITTEYEAKLSKKKWKEIKKQYRRESGKWKLEPIWDIILERAYENDGEGMTHPLVYIGGNDLSLAQLRYIPPLKSSKDSHGNYPMNGIYIDVGPFKAAESIRKKSNTNILKFRTDDKIELLPDWEVVHEQVYNTTVVSDSIKNIREKWFWLFLPIYWGNPSVESNFQKQIRIVDLGNISPLTPTYNSTTNNGWNKTGAVRGYDLYEVKGLKPRGSIVFMFPDIGVANIISIFIGHVPLLHSTATGVLKLIRQKHFFYPEDKKYDYEIGVNTYLKTHKNRSVLRYFAVTKKEMEAIEDNDLLFNSDCFYDGDNYGFGIRSCIPVYRSFLVIESSYNLNWGGDMNLIINDVNNNNYLYIYINDYLKHELIGGIRSNLFENRVTPFVRLGLGYSFLSMRRTYDTNMSSLYEENVFNGDYFPKYYEPNILLWSIGLEFKRFLHENIIIRTEFQRSFTNFKDNKNDVRRLCNNDLKVEFIFSY